MTANGHVNGKNGLWQSTKNGNPPARAREAEEVSNIYVYIYIYNAADWGGVDILHSS